MDNLTSRSLFVPSVVPSIGKTNMPSFRGRPAPMNNSQISMMNKVSAAKQVWDAIPPDAKQKGVDFVINKMSSNKGGGSNNPQSSEGSGGGSYALSKAPNPSKISINSGIEPNAWVSDVLDTTENVCSPLHMTGVNFKFPTYVGAKLLDYFNLIIGFDIQTKAQANVGFNLKVDTDFTVDKILAAFNALVYATQIYLYHMSIITYHSDPGNKNEGMINLRSQMDPATMDALSLLGRRLADTPIPPNLLEFLRYLSGNFYSGDNQGAPMIKIYPLTYNATTGTGLISSTEITASLNALNSSANNLVFALMRRAVPQWMPGYYKDVPVIPVFDKQFLTFFTNLPFSINPAIGTQTLYPVVASATDPISYNSWTNNLDGLIYACTSAVIGAGTDWAPGLITPVLGSGTNTGNTRISYYEVGGVKKFYASRLNFLTRSRMDSYAPNEALTAIITPHLYGTDKVRGVSTETIRETAYKSMDYLFSLDTIKRNITRNPNNPAARTFDNDGRSKPRSGRRRN